MTNFSIGSQLPIYLGLNGMGLNNGKVYIGLPNQDPQTFPKTVYWDAAGTDPVDQTDGIATIGGYISRAGNPAAVYTDGSYSIRVRDRHGNEMFYIPEAADEMAVLGTPGGAGQIGWIQAGAGAVARTVEEKLRDTRTVEDWGAVGDNATDDTAAIQKMIDAVGYFRLSAKTYRITSTLFVPAGGPYGTLWHGEGMEQSALRCDGMAGLSAIKAANVASLYRVTMRDFKVYGDCDTAIDFSGMTGGDQLYASEFRNLWLESDANSAIWMTNQFSTIFQNVHCYSSNGNSFEIEGDVATTLIGCYAHECGAGKAGYRIQGIATMIECNGLNIGDIWGDFGAALAPDGVNVQFRIKMMGCNMEDFAVKGLRLRYTGTLEFFVVGVIPKAVGTFETVIDGSEYGAAGWRFYDHGSFYASKGSTMTQPSRILYNSAPADLVSTGTFPDMRRTDQATTYAIPTEATANSAFAVYARQFANVTWTRAYGYVLQVPTLWTVNALTFDVTRLNTVRTANTVATSMRVATGGEKGQRLTIIVEDANTTIQHNFASNGRFLTLSGANIAATNGGVYEFVSNGTNWVQV